MVGLLKAVKAVEWVIGLALWIGTIWSFMFLDPSLLLAGITFFFPPAMLVTPWFTSQEWLLGLWAAAIAVLILDFVLGQVVKRQEQLEFERRYFGE